VFAKIFHLCSKVISSLLESASELASKDNKSQHVFWAAIFVFANQLVHILQFFEKETLLGSTVPVAEWLSSEFFRLGLKLEKGLFA
jgi:hypothetical protein